MEHVQHNSNQKVVQTVFQKKKTTMDTLLGMGHDAKKTVNKEPEATC